MISYKVFKTLKVLSKLEARVVELVDTPDLGSGAETYNRSIIPHS